MRNGFAIAVTAFVTLTSSLTSAPARAQVDDKKPTPAEMREARERYSRATQLYEEGAYSQALIEFERAYQIAPASKILYNIAQVAIALRDYAKAITFLRRYVAEDKTIPWGRKLKVKKELEDLEGRVAELTISVDLGGAKVRIDDVEVGTAPLVEPIVVNTGRRVIEAEKDGLFATEAVVVAGKDQVEVTLELKRPELDEDTILLATPPAPQPEPPPPPEESSDVWIGWVVTGGLAAGAVATGLAAFLSTRELSNLRETQGVTLDDLEAQQTEARALGITADVLIGLTTISAGVSLYFTIAEATDDGTPSARLQLVPTGTGAALRGRF